MRITYPEYTLSKVFRPRSLVYGSKVSQWFQLHLGNGSPYLLTLVYTIDNMDSYFAYRLELHYLLFCARQQLYEWKSPQQSIKSLYTQDSIHVTRINSGWIADKCVIPRRTTTSSDKLAKGPWVTDIAKNTHGWHIENHRIEES